MTISASGPYLWFPRIATLVAALACLGTSATAAAQRPEEVALARRLFEQGVEATERREWDSAADSFRRSAELAPRPMTFYNLATVLERGDRLVAASEAFRRFLHESNQSRYETYRETATQKLQSLEERIPLLLIRIENLQDDDVVTMDEIEVPHAGLGVAMPVDPGEHTIVVTRNETELGREQVRLREQQRRQVDIELEEATPEPPSPTVAAASTQTEQSGRTSAPSAATAADEPAESNEGGDDLTPLWVVLGVVGAGAIAGAVAAGVVLSEPDPVYQSTLPVFQL